MQVFKFRLCEKFSAGVAQKTGQRPLGAAMSSSPDRKILRFVDIGEDLLCVIVARISDPKDRSSISLVAKEWQRVEGLTRSSIRVKKPSLLHRLLPRFPNLTSFVCSLPIRDTHIEFIADGCPKLETLTLDCFGTLSGDVTDAGLCAIAKGCPNLSRISLRYKQEIGDEGVIRLVDRLRNLTCLDLAGCNQVTDQSLEAIGKARQLKSLNLAGCALITDVGLLRLAYGPLLNTLKNLVLSDCDRITDVGVKCLGSMSSLEELNLGFCGSITDNGGEALSRIRSLKMLDLSWSDVNDTTLVLLAGNCKALKKLVISGCWDVTGYGIRCFGSHKSLEELVVFACFQIGREDLNYLVSSCHSLKCITLDRNENNCIHEYGGH